MVKEGYKQTEVGVIPEDWSVEKFQDLTEVITCGLAATPTYVAETIGKPFLSAQNVRDGRVVYENYKFISRDLFTQITKHNKPSKGDVLYTRVGAGIGEAGVIEDDFEFAIYVSLTLIKPKSSKLDSYFIAHLLNSSRFRFLAKNGLFAGAGVQNLNVEVVRNFAIPLPSLEEQRSIAQALSDVNALIAALDKAIAKKRHLKTATMQQLLTGKKRLPGFGEGKGYKEGAIGKIPEEWEFEALTGKIAIIHGFGFQSQHFKSQGTYRLTTPGNFFEEGGFREIEEKQKYYDGPLPNGYLLKYGDLIVAMTEQAEGLLGSAALIPEIGKYLHNQRIGKIELIASNIELGFLYYIFNSEKFRLKVRETAAGTKVKHTSPNKLLEIAVPLPSLPEQRAIATVLSDMDAEIAALETRLAKTQALKQGMMQQLLTGKVRLKIEA